MPGAGVEVSPWLSLSAGRSSSQVSPAAVWTLHRLQPFRRGPHGPPQAAALQEMSPRSPHGLHPSGVSGATDRPVCALGWRNRREPAVSGMGSLSLSSQRIPAGSTWPQTCSTSDPLILRKSKIIRVAHHGEAGEGVFGWRGKEE